MIGVTKSSGMSNKLNNVIYRNSAYCYWRDRYPGSRFIDHLLRFKNNLAVHILVLLGEVGGLKNTKSATHDVLEPAHPTLSLKSSLVVLVHWLMKIWRLPLQTRH